MHNNCQDSINLHTWTCRQLASTCVVLVILCCVHDLHAVLVSSLIGNGGNGGAKDSGRFFQKGGKIALNELKPYTQNPRPSWSFDGCVGTEETIEETHTSQRDREESQTPFFLSQD